MKFVVLDIEEHEDGSATYHFDCDDEFIDRYKQAHSMEEFDSEHFERFVQEALTEGAKGSGTH